jgi:hypothetical protein
MTMVAAETKLAAETISRKFNLLPLG